jgi:ubiquinone/menaquinone biosynthesis C-methylase UbiE
MAQDRETYTHGHHESVVEQHAMRTAGEAAAFLQPFLRPDMALLDIGCGPGSITVGLAEWLPDGSVVGVELDEGVLEAGRDQARDMGLANVQFQVASVYALPFEDESFDAVYGHQVLQHLGQPDDALTEALRVLKPGGVIGVREVDWGSTVAWPEMSEITRFLDIYHRVAARNGGDADVGRRLRSLLNGAGFADVRVAAGVWSFGTTDLTKQWGESWARRVLESSIADRAVEYGIASKQELEEVSAGWLRWSVEPDAYFSFSHGEAVGWKAR